METLNNYGSKKYLSVRYMKYKMYNINTLKHIVKLVQKKLSREYLIYLKIEKGEMGLVII